MTEPREKIEKLLRLAASKNESEAAAALNKARILMEKYGFTEADFEESDDSIKNPFEAEMFRVLHDFTSDKEAREFIRSHAFVNPDAQYQEGVLDGLHEALSDIYSESDLFSHSSSGDSLFVTENDLFEDLFVTGTVNESSADQWDSLLETREGPESLFEDVPGTSVHSAVWKKGRNEAYHSLISFLRK